MELTDEYFKNKARELTEKRVSLIEQQKQLLEEVEEMYKDFLIENSLDKEVIHKKDSDDVAYIYPFTNCEDYDMYNINVVMTYTSAYADDSEKLAVPKADSNDYTEVLKEIKENYVPAFERTQKQYYK